MVAPMWAEEQELQGRTSRPRIVSPARQRWATPDVLDGIRMWHDDQPSGPRRGLPSSRSQAEESGLPANHAEALAGRLRPVDIGVGALSRSESALSPERAAAAAVHAAPGMWDEPNCDTRQHRPAPRHVPSCRSATAETTRLERRRPHAESAAGAQRELADCFAEPSTGHRKSGQSWCRPGFHPTKPRPSWCRSSAAMRGSSSTSGGRCV